MKHQISGRELKSKKTLSSISQTKDEVCSQIRADLKDDKILVTLFLLHTDRDMICTHVKSKLTIKQENGDVICSKSFQNYSCGEDREQQYTCSVETEGLELIGAKIRVDFVCQDDIPVIGDPLSPLSGDVIEPPTSSLFMTDRMSDVTFVFENTSDEGVANTFYGHKAILSMASPMFQAMLETSLPKSHDVIVLQASEWMPFMTIMRFIYCDEVVIHPDHVVATLKAAEQYQIPEISFAVAVFLNDDNIIDILNYTHGTDAKRLAHPCAEYVRTNVYKVPTNVIKKKFARLTPAAVKSIVSDCQLPAKPLHLWNLCIAWSVGENRRRGIKSPTHEDQRSVMADFIQDFKFENMDAAEFAEGPAKSKILTMDEINEIQSHYYCSEPLVRFKRNPETNDVAKRKMRAKKRDRDCGYKYVSMYDWNPKARDVFTLLGFYALTYWMMFIIVQSSCFGLMRGEVEEVKLQNDTVTGEMKHPNETFQQLHQEILWKKETIMQLKDQNVKLQQDLKKTEIERDALIAAKGTSHESN